MARVCAAVWAEPAANPWAAIPAVAIAAEIGVPEPAPGVPGMFRCAAPGSVASVFERTGLGDVEEWEVPTRLLTGSAEEYWQQLATLATPVFDVLREADVHTARRIAAMVILAARVFESGGRVRMPGRARCVIGTVP